MVALAPDQITLRVQTASKSPRILFADARARIHATLNCDATAELSPKIELIAVRRKNGDQEYRGRFLTIENVSCDPDVPAILHADLVLHGQALTAALAALHSPQPHKGDPAKDPPYGAANPSHVHPENTAEGRGGPAAFARAVIQQESLHVHVRIQGKHDRLLFIKLAPR